MNNKRKLLNKKTTKEILKYKYKAHGTKYDQSYVYLVYIRYGNNFLKINPCPPLFLFLFFVVVEIIMIKLFVFIMNFCFSFFF